MNTRAILYDGNIESISLKREMPTIRRELEPLFSAYPLELDIFAPGLNEKYLFNLHTVRKTISESEIIRQAVLSALGECWQRDLLYVDRVRFRCIPDRFQSHPAASALLCWHRDTYYANAACQINLWIPLTDCDRNNGIAFFPELLNQKLPNDSADFELNRWERAGGFQAYKEEKPSGTGLTYPSAVGPFDPDKAWAPNVNVPDSLLFAGRHLHGTMPNVSGAPRYSLECRFCHLDDIERADLALNVDSYSRGSFLSSFRNAATGDPIPVELAQDYCKRTDRSSQTVESNRTDRRGPTERGQDQ